MDWKKFNRNVYLNAHFDKQTQSEKNKQTIQDVTAKYNNYCK